MRKMLYVRNFKQSTQYSYTCKVIMNHFGNMYINESVWLLSMVRHTFTWTLSALLSCSFWKELQFYQQLGHAYPFHLLYQNHKNREQISFKLFFGVLLLYKVYRKSYMMHFCLNNNSKWTIFSKIVWEYDLKKHF